MARVFIPAQLRELSGGAKQIELPGTTLRQIIDGLEAAFPGIRERLCSGGAISPALQVSIDGALTSRGLLAPVAPDSEIHFLPAIGGG